MRKIILLSLSVFLFSFYSVYFIIYEKEEVFAFTSEREGGFEVDVAGSDVAWVWKENETANYQNIINCWLWVARFF